MSDKDHPSAMAHKTFLSKIQANERLLKQHAHAVSQDDYEKLVAEHLHLIASLKAHRRKQDRKQGKK